MNRRLRRPAPLVCAALTALLRLPARAQMVTGHEMPGFAETFGLTADKSARDWNLKEVQVFVGNSTGANVLYPNELASVTFRFTSKSVPVLPEKIKFEIIPYATSVPIGDVWTPHVRRLPGGSVQTLTTNPASAAHASQVTVTLDFPKRYGGYAVIAEVPGRGRAFAGTFVRVPPPDPGRVFAPTYALDLPWPFEISEAVATLFERLGIKGCRMGAGYYPTTAKDFEAHNAEFYQQLAWAQKHDITVMLTLGDGGAPNPLGRPRPWLNEKDELLDTKSDQAWLPQYDNDFTRWTADLALFHGYPLGPVNAVELWNEPWEGISISGWGADLLRYRELYRHMASGVEKARQNGARVLIGGACSSSNTRDKLFPDNSDEFLKWLDFVSIHYQPLAADPALDKKWQARGGEYGRVKVWDTESWVANSEDRVAAVIASMRAQGQDRTAGIYGGNVFSPEIVSDSPRVGIAQVWSPAAAVAASQKFIGQREFGEILFKNGLPWVFVFRPQRVGIEPPPRPSSPLTRGETQERLYSPLPAAQHRVPDTSGGVTRSPAGVREAQNAKPRTPSPPSPEDGTLVIVGDLGLVYERSRSLFRDVTGVANGPKIRAAQVKAASLPPSSKEEERKAVDDALLASQVTEGATLTLPDGGGEFVLFDFYGNPLEAQNGKITVPLNGLGYYLRTRGHIGSFASLQRAVSNAVIRGYTPVSVKVKDFTVSPDRSPRLNLELTNIYNRPISGKLSVSLQNGVSSSITVKLEPHQSRAMSVDANLTPTPENAYRLHLEFDAEGDGKSVHEETLHTNLISHRIVVVDGNLRDWEGAFPQTASASIGQSLTEAAYKPFLSFGKETPGGTATGYLAYDADYFYFAAKAADATPYEGNVRFETRDDDRYFYPAKVFEAGQNGKERRELVWPSGVRRYSYRQDPDLPSGNGTDNVQIAFNVLSESDKPWLTHPHGTMPHFMTYADTDYEFAFNEVAAKYGGGTEIWELSKPGAPHKHFYPRQPHSDRDGGPVKDGKLVMKRSGSTRIIEAAIPWRVIPEVEKAMKAKHPVKFSFRINDNGGPAYELSAGRSTAKTGNPTFHNDWATHWANELEFGWEE